MPTHDNAYKHVFSHPKAVQDLLRGFVHEDWVQHLDYSTLEKVSGSYISDDLRDREDDIIWRIRMHADTPGATKTTHSDGNDDKDSPDPNATIGEWLYVYLLLEFQSSNDPWMAVRILTYIGLLYQDLIKSGQTKARKLPAVFPLVLYNGEAPWAAARELDELIEPVPPSLAAWRLSLIHISEPTRPY